MKINKPLWIGIACGIGCALCVALYLGLVDYEAREARAEALARYGGDQLEVCVATRTINAGEIIDENAIEAKMWLVDFLPTDAMTERSSVVGKRAGSTILAGEVISALRFEETGQSLHVPEGLVAVSVPARDVQAVGGALASGMHVNVYATGSSQTELILRDVLVLATSITASTSSNSSTAWITLAVDPTRVQEVVSAAQNLELYFVLPDKAALDADDFDDTDGRADLSSGMGDSGDDAFSDGGLSGADNADGDQTLAPQEPMPQGEDGENGLQQGASDNAQNDGAPDDSVVLRSRGGDLHE